MKLIITAAAAGLALWWYSKKSKANQNDTDTETSLFTDIMDTITSAPSNLADTVRAATGNVQTLSAGGLNLIKKFEGFAATPYPDHKGFSIGYGHLIKAGENLSIVTVDQATELLMADVAWAEQAVRTAVDVPLDDNEFDALVSLTFNIGAGAFKKSTLVKKLNSGDYSGAADQFAVWNLASGKINGALVARRDAEADLFNTEATTA